MRTKRRSDTKVACGRRALLDELGISEGTRRAAPERTGYGCGCPECVARQWNTQRLEHWICGRLTAAGADEAQVDARVDDIPVDVYWRRGDRRCVVEVRTGPLDITAARAHRERLRAAGIDDVLWVCPRGYWVPLVPAVGIADFAPASADYRIDQGMLAAGESGFATASRASWELRDVLAGWVNGEIHWGHVDLMTGGWAEVGTWERHTGAQAALIEQQRKQLRDQRVELAVSRQTVRDKQKLVSRLHHRIDRAGVNADAEAITLAGVRSELVAQQRIAAGLRATIARMDRTINQWQWLTCCAMLLCVTLMAGAMVMR
ncbi:hypothetical protein AB0H58_12330 [Nocardia neocaledoniensis]|uniref:hypothetical protein n=1 Tax=Nocardia TaxID=1817 RepID=UPI001E5B9657|nr:MULTISPECIES: hypothetical protein [Nocardia]UGT56615.1 hypothetical protein LTT85_07035 [Nocardia asteroides]